ncbi:uncharacterized protein si:dkey-192k22.2 [Trichomycterus rosablanca]|uniref:uncharacterized protein si:dkey-192k22.2 n=1 Tax=Trichomycterus rosablanca TaxID=2290929 RepID=UPI002F353F60
MARRTLIKLFVLVLLTFIICLPEFFPSEKVSQITFLCSPFDPCDPPGGRGHHDGKVYTVLDYVSESYALCEVEPKNATNRDQALNEWFVCKTEADLEGLRHNASISEIDVEVVLMLQTMDLAYQNFTVSGHFNHTGLHIETQHNITLLNCCGQFQPNSQQLNKVRTPSGLSSSGSVPLKASGSDSDGSSTESTHMKLSERKDSAFNPRQSNRSHYFLQLKEVPKAPDNAEKPVVVSPPANQPASFSKRRVKSLSDLPDSMSMFDTQDKKRFQQRTLQKTNHSRDQFLLVFQETYRRALSPIQEMSLTDVAVDEDDKEQNDDVITDEGCDLDIPLTPAHIHSDTFTFLHHRSHPPTVDLTMKTMS